MSARKIRVGVFGHDLKFWYPLQRELEQTGLFEFRDDIWAGHDQHDALKSQALIDWADVMIAEWAMENAVFCSTRKRKEQRLIIRLHLQERGSTYPERIDYSAVDALVFVGQHILDECVEKFDIPRDVCRVVGNYVDVEKYALPKFGGADFNLGIIGTAPKRKRLDLAVDTLELLLKKDQRYMLRVKGNSPAGIDWLWARGAEREYYCSVYSRINSGDLRHKVVFDPQGSDVAPWLEMIGFLLSPSDFESFHMAVAEGAASGAAPIVWNWEGASDIYPELHTVTSAIEAAERIEFLNKSSSSARLRLQMQEAIRHRFDKAGVVNTWKNLLYSAPSAVLAAHSPSRSVLIVWAVDEWVTFHRREMLEALALHLKETHDLIVIEPGNHYETIGRLGWAPLEELAKIGKGQLLKVGENIFRTRLFTGGIPAGSGFASFQGLPNQLDVLGGLIAKHYGADAEVLHWVYKPDQAERLPVGARYIYEVYDDYTINFGTGEVYPGVAETERLAVERAEHVFFTSQPLLDRKSAGARSLGLVGNGVVTEVFERYRLPRRPRIGRPVAGYLGNLATFFDWRLMVEVCKAMPHVDFVFHGQVELAAGSAAHAHYQRMRDMSNVVFTGRVNRVRGAAAINQYDVLLIPFVVNEAMHAVNPLKLWEYFATGLPVISSPMEAITEPAPLLLVAHTSGEWVEKMESVLKEDAPGAREQRIQRAQEHCWKRLTKMHAQVVSDLSV